MVHLPYRDILSLGQVCRALQEFLSLRSTWIAILKSLCVEKGVYLPSYPAADMDVAQLQNAAKGTYRWGCLLKENGKKSHEDHSNTTELPHVSKVFLPGPEPPNDKRHILIPGGRYLVTADHHNLILLDLGYVGTQVRPTVVDKVSLLEPHVPDFDICDLTFRLIENDGLRIAVAADVLAKVYDIFPTSVEPRFQELGKISLFDVGICWRLSILGDRLFMKWAETIVCWNFATGRYILGPKRGRADEVICTEDLCIHFNRVSASLDVWRIPSWDDQSEAVPSTILPSLRRSHPRIQGAVPDFIIPLNCTVSSQARLRYILPSSSLHATALPLTFDVFACFDVNVDVTQPTIAYRYRLDAVWKQNPRRLVDMKLDQLATFSFPPYAPDQKFFPKGYPGPADLQIGLPSSAMIRSLIFLQNGDYPFLFKDSIYSVVLPDESGEEDPHIDAQGTGKRANAIVTHLHSYGVGVEGISLCTATGRVLYMAKLELPDGVRKEFVVDYLA
ncbi:hypothetical protein H1R20_g14108, partial [Candolleomyces eurysporus]